MSTLSEQKVTDKTCPIGHCFYTTEFHGYYKKLCDYNVQRKKVILKSFTENLLSSSKLYFLSKPDKNNEHFERGPMRDAALNSSWLRYVKESVTRAGPNNKSKDLNEVQIDILKIFIMNI